MSDQTTRLADVLRELFPPPASYEEWQEAVDRSYEGDAARLIAAGVRVGDAALREAAQAYLDAFDMPLTTDPEVHYDTLTAARDALRAALGDKP